MRLGIVFFLAVAICHGCSCMALPTGNPACQSVWGHSAVFTGVVTAIDDPGILRLAPGESLPPLDRYPQKQVSIKITQSFTGLDSSAKEITIETGIGGGDCGYGFERGVEYVIYAFKKPNGRLSSGRCSPTRPVSDAAEDLTYLRQLAKADPVGEIRVTVFDPHKSWGNVQPAGGIAGLGDAQVAIAGQGLKKTSSTDRNGRSMFNNLPPGEYQVSAKLDGYTSSMPLRPVKLHAKGCAEVPVALRLDRVITGRLLTKGGLPAAGLIVEAVRRHPRREYELPHAADSATTDKDGRYELRNLSAGDYYLGLSLAHSPTIAMPYTRWFYPGTEDVAAAVFVHISDNPEKQQFDMTVPSPQNPRILEGSVGWPDGRRAVGAQVILEDPRWPWQMASSSPSTDDAGRFKTTALDGTTYRIHAVSLQTNGPVSAEPISVAPGAGPAKVVLVLTRKGHTHSEQAVKAIEALRNGQALR